MIRKCALLLMSGLVADAGLYFGLRSLDSSRLFYDRSAVSPHRIDQWVRSGYDAELGWDIPPGSKNNLGASRHADYHSAARCDLKAFGDSFTFGSDVPDSETWPAQVERVTGWTCPNYGVPGYGPDQALLKYERTCVPSNVTILGIQEENIARVVNIYRAFYMEDWGPPKPRFFLDADGLRLEPNPVPRPEGASLLLNPAFVDGLRLLDYWPRYNERVLGAPRRLEWPGAWTVLRHAPFFARRSALELRLRYRPQYEDEIQRYRFYHLYGESSEAFRILTCVIDRFVGVAQERGERPLILLFPMENSVELLRRYRRAPNQTLARNLASRGIPHIDFGPIFAGDDFRRYYGRQNGHFSAAGNERVAREVIHFLGRAQPI